MGAAVRRARHPAATHRHIGDTAAEIKVLDTAAPSPMYAMLQGVTNILDLDAVAWRFCSLHRRYLMMCRYMRTSRGADLSAVRLTLDHGERQFTTMNTRDNFVL